MGFRREQVYEFLGNEIPPAAGVSDAAPFRSRITKTAGSPTVASANGFMALSLDATSEVQVAGLYMGDQLGWKLSNLVQVDFWLKLSAATLAAAVNATFGVCGVAADDITALTTFAGFRLSGTTPAAAAPLSVRAYGGSVADTGDVATGLTLANVVKRFTIDFANGVAIRVPPPSLGGAANILFDADNDYQNLQEVARGTQFNLGSVASNVQLFAQIQKSANAAVGGLAIERIRVRYKAD